MSKRSDMNMGKSNKEGTSKSNSKPGFRIITSNVFEHNYGMPNIIYESDFDMLCIQEGPYTSEILEDYFPKSEYDVIWSPESESSHLFCVLCKKNGWRLSTTTNSATNTSQSVMEEVWDQSKNLREGSKKPNCLTARTALVVSLTNEITSETIKVANLHLCGGRYDEKEISTPAVTMQDVDIAGVKNGLLAQVLEHDPDVVVGDFNSDVVCYVDFCRLSRVERDVTGDGGNGIASSNGESEVYIDEAQLHFWKTLANCDNDNGKDCDSDETRNKLQEWNCAPFKLLESRGFEVAHQNSGGLDEYAKGVMDMFQHHGTSLYGTTPDAIWYKTGTEKGNFEQPSGERIDGKRRTEKKDLFLTEFQRICLMPQPPHTHNKMVSDHDALGATFRFG